MPIRESRPLYEECAKGCGRSYPNPIGIGRGGHDWYNANDDEDAVALYERAAGTIACQPGDRMRLDDPALRSTLIAVAVAHNLVPPP